MLCSRLFKLPPSLGLFNHKITSIQRLPAEGHLSQLAALAGKDKCWKKCQFSVSSVTQVPGPKGCSRANQLLCSPCSSMRASAACLQQPVQGKVWRNTEIPPGGFESLSTSCTASVRREISALSNLTALSIATFISDTGFVMPAHTNRGVMKHWDE